jgi:MerR family transcriptional regulator, heat shock protein HspR
MAQILVLHMWSIQEEPVQTNGEHPVTRSGGTLYSIGEAADLLKVSIPLLRLYEREGLILPLRKSSRHRLYSATDLERIRCIREMINEQKVSIEGIKRLLALIPCWKIKNCPEDQRSSCKAFTSPTAPCWLQTGRTWDCKSAVCRVCPVYETYASCSQLKPTIVKYTTDGVSAQAAG